MKQPTQILILPGLDGTDFLLQEFCNLAPAETEAEVCTLPDAELTYKELRDHFAETFDVNKQYVLIAESFSGPLGILLAHRFPDLVNRLVLVSTFACGPPCTGLRLLNSLNFNGMIFRIGLPRFVARRYFLGRDNDVLINRLQTSVKTQAPKTLKHRIAQVANVDVRSELSQLPCRVDYVQPTADRLVPKKSLDQILKAKPDVEVHRIAGPHLIMQTKPTDVWKKLKLN